MKLLPKLLGTFSYAFSENALAFGLDSSSRVAMDYFLMQCLPLCAKKKC